MPPDRLAIKFGKKTAEQLIVATVLELSYTAVDLALFARDLGHIAKDGSAKPPFTWDDNRRMNLRAKLDALFFNLYGITDRKTISYVYSTFPIVEGEETEAYGRYLSRDLCLAWINALAAGDPDATVQL